MTAPTAYPLTWPVGWKRTPADRRKPGMFAKKGPPEGMGGWRHTKDVTVAQAIERLLGELKRMGVNQRSVIISTDLLLRQDGLPRSDQRNPADPGAAVYWRDEIAVGGAQDRCMAIDVYTKVEQNIAALAATVEAMRAIERHGGAVVLDRAFAGFTALPAPIVAGMKRDWQAVLELRALLQPTREDVIAAHRRLAMKLHPDKGGTDAQMAELNAARDEALREVGA